MTTHHDPGHGFVIEHDQRDTGRPRSTVGADHGHFIRLSVRGMNGVHGYSPAEAREVGAALTAWADEKEAP